MNAAVDSLNRIASMWWSWSLHSTWQGFLLLALVLLAFTVWRRATPQLRYGLLILVLLKFTLPPLGASGLNLYDRFLDLFSRGSEAPSSNPLREGLLAFENYGVVVYEDLPEAMSSTTRPSEPPRFTLKNLSPATWMLGIHLMGVAVFLLLIAYQVLRLRARLRRGKRIEEGAFYSLNVRLAVDLGLRKPPRLFLSDEIETPMVGGLFRPFILLPAWVEHADLEERRLLLAHEAAHLKRRDPICNWFQILAQVWLWWNPIVWVLNSRIRAERELCCDDLVLSFNFGSGGEYSRILVEVAGRCARFGETTLEAMGLADSFRHTKSRIVRALDTSLARRAKMSLATVLLLGLLAAVALPGGRERTSSLAQKLEGELDSLGTTVMDYQLATSSVKDATDPPTPTFRFGYVNEIFPQLTSPIAVVSSIPPDPFDPQGKPLLAATDSPFQLLLISVGPNGKLDASPREVEESFKDPATLDFRLHYDWAYSPTNGSSSVGDIFWYRSVDVGPRREMIPQVPTADFRFNTSDLFVLWKPPTLPILGSWKLVLCAEVINAGSVTQPVRVAFFHGDPKVGGTLIGEVTETVPAGTIIPTIITTGPNGEKIERPGTELPPSPKVRAIQLEWNASPGQHEVYCVLDPQHAVQELDETNNFAHRWVYVKPLLEVANENAALPKHANEKVQAIIDAYNAGNLDAILPFLGDSDAVTVRQQAIIALGNSYGDLPRLATHMEPLEKMLFSPSGVDRGAAASALMSREDEFFKRNRDTILRMATDDPDIRVRELVSANLKNSGRSRSETESAKSEPTGAVQGRALFDGKPWSNGRIVYSRYWPDSNLPYTQPTTTDANGFFRIKEVLPGKYHFGILKMWEVESGGMTSAMGTHSHGAYVDVVPGETAEIQIGGSGRKVIGKLIPVPNEEGDSPNLRALEKRYLSGEVPRPEGFEGNIPGNLWVLSINPDGAFKVPDVPPGEYELMFEQADLARGATSENRFRDIFPAPRRVHISDAGPGEEDKPVDLGEVKVRLYDKKRDTTTEVALDRVGQ